MKDKLLIKSPFQLTFLFVFGLMTSLMMALGPNSNVLEPSEEEAYSLFSVDCKVKAGTMSNSSPYATIINGSATLNATADGNAGFPDGFVNIYVLTQGSNLIIVDAGPEPSFEVTEPGEYTIHSFVFNPDTLDLNIIQFGSTTGFDVFGLIKPGGGEICADLDVEGAQFKVDEEQCTADAGTMSTDMPNVELSSGTATLVAMADGNAVVPEGYVQAFVLTQGDGLVILNYGFEASFEVTEAGDYTIHSLVFDPTTLDINIVQPGVTTGFDVFGLIIAGGGDICASLDVAGASFKVDEEQCTADAGTMSTDMPNVELSGGTATLMATADGNAVVPEGYVQAFVLTQGDGLVILDYGFEASFEVTEASDYTIHSLVFDPTTLDINIVQLGVTTGFDVFGLIIAGGGDICASLDVAGTSFKVDEEQCTADAGTMSTDMPNVELSGGTATLMATADGNAVVPEGYVQAFVLTQGDGLVILDYGFEASFEVTEAGDYTIHSLVFDPTTLDITIVQPGVTTGFDVFGLIIAGGGDICASLDVAGASFKVDEEQCTADAGTMSTDMPNVELSGGTATLMATADGNAIVPEGYVQAFVLTQGDGLVILDYGFEASFEVTEAGDYTIHSLVFDPTTLDINIVQPGVTTGFDVFGLIIAGGGDICASLDVAGASFKVDEEQCTADAGTMYSEHPIGCLSSGGATISAEIGDTPTIPDGYQQIFVLTRAFSLTIIDASAVPEFTVSHPGFYRIHSLVYNPETLDLSIVDFGSTTGFDVLHLVEQNNICASLDVHGALNLVIPNWICHIFNNFRIGDETALIESYMDDFESYQAFEDSFKEEHLNIRVYPNPTSSVVSLEAKMVPKETINYTVIDVSGRVMLTGKTTEFENANSSIDMSQLRDGTYFVRFESEYRSFTKAVQVRK